MTGTGARILDGSAVKHWFMLGGMDPWQTMQLKRWRRLFYGNLFASAFNGGMMISWLDTFERVGARWWTLILFCTAFVCSAMSARYALDCFRRVKHYQNQGL